MWISRRYVGKSFTDMTNRFKRLRTISLGGLSKKMKEVAEVEKPGDDMLRELQKLSDDFHNEVEGLKSALASTRKFVDSIGKHASDGAKDNQE